MTLSKCGSRARFPKINPAVGIYLNAEDSEDDEECAADQYNVADGFEGRQECLDNQLEPWCPVDDPERPQGSDQSEHAEDVEDLGPLPKDNGHQGVHHGDQHQRPVHDVPAGLEVGVLSIQQPSRDSLKQYTESCVSA